MSRLVVPARAVSRCPVRDPGARSGLAHRLPDEAARSVLHGRGAPSGGAQTHAAGRTFRVRLDRRPINVGDAARLAGVTDAWARGDEVEGWARYWAYIYGHLADRLAANPALKDASLVVRFEELCRSPYEMLERTLAHCRLDTTPIWLEQKSAAIHFPSYYKPRFAPAELETIDRHAADTAARFGYTGAARSAPTWRRRSDLLSYWPFGPLHRTSVLQAEVRPPCGHCSRHGRKCTVEWRSRHTRAGRRQLQPVWNLWTDGPRQRRAGRMTCPQGQSGPSKGELPCQSRKPYRLPRSALAARSAAAGRSPDRAVDERRLDRSRGVIQISS